MAASSALKTRTAGPPSLWCRRRLHLDVGVAVVFLEGLRVLRLLAGNGPDALALDVEVARLPRGAFGLFDRLHMGRVGEADIAQSDAGEAAPQRGRQLVDVQRAGRNG